MLNCPVTSAVTGSGGRAMRRVPWRRIVHDASDAARRTSRSDCALTNFSVPRASKHTIRTNSFVPVEVIHERTGTRSAPRGERAAQEPVIHADCRRDVGPRHRRERSDFLADGSGPVSRVARPRPRTTGVARRSGPVPRPNGQQHDLLVSDVRRFPRSKRSPCRCARTIPDVDDRRLERRRGPGRGGSRIGQLLRGAGREASSRPRVHRG